MRLKKLAKVAMVLFVGVPIFSLPLAIIGALQDSDKSLMVTASFLASISGGTFTIFDGAGSPYTAMLLLLRQTVEMMTQNQA